MTQGHPRLQPRRQASHSDANSDASADLGTVTIHVLLQFHRRCGRKVLLAPGAGPQSTAAPTMSVKSALAITPAVRALARAFRWRRLIETGVHATVQEIAEAEGINPSFVSRVLRMTLWSPQIIDLILSAQCAARMNDLLKPFSVQWVKQSEDFNGPPRRVPG